MEYIYVLGTHFARVDGNLADGDTATYFYHTDHLGSAVLVTNGVGEVVWSSEYTPFGQLALEEGVLAKAAKFTGKDLDADTGLYYFNARWYDVEMGRFITLDPLRDGLNWYGYAMANPLKFIDPTGQANEFSIGGGINYREEILKVNPLSWDTLKLKSTGSQVTELQKVLQYLGYKTDVDGVYGKGTLKSVKEFQRDNNLSEDGAIGQNGRIAFAKALGISENIMELVEVDVDLTANEIYPLMQPEAAEAFQTFLEDVRKDSTIPAISFSEMFRPQKKQAHFRAIYLDGETSELTNYSIKKGVNPAGTSFHEVGLAFDANIGSLSNVKERGLFL